MYIARFVLLLHLRSTRYRLPHLRSTRYRSSGPIQELYGKRVVLVIVVFDVVVVVMVIVVVVVLLSASDWTSWQAFCK